jgi:predicted PurR-regulated permease PerM
MPKKIEISHKTILFTIGILIGGWLILQIRDIIYLLFISFILTTAFRPFVDFLTKYKVPRVVAILLLYILGIAGFSTLIGSLVPQIVLQSAKLGQDLPRVVAEILPSLNIDFRAITQDIAPITQNVVKVGFEIFNNVVGFVTVMVFTFYFLLGRKQFDVAIKKFFGENQALKITNIILDVEEKLGNWARGQILLMIIIGVFTYIGLTLLKVDYALPLAVIAGLLEVVPMVGPIVSAVPAVLISFTISPLLAVSVAALYFVIQQLENHFIVPWVMKKNVGLSPVLTIVAFMVGARFEGVIGAILAIPAILVGQVIVNHVLQLKSKSTPPSEIS